MTGPRISVIIPTFNREALLPRAIESVISQSVSDWEIILIDDGSTDGTPKLVEQYANRLGERFRSARQPHTGCGAARNRGIELARGELVAFLDSDDEFFPEKLERQVDLFRLRPELGLVYSDYAFIDLQGKRHGSVWDCLTPRAREVSAEKVAPGLYVCGGNLFYVLVQGYFIATIVGLVRRDVLGEGIRFSPDPSYSAEWLFYLRVVKSCRAGFVDEPLCLHHHTAGSATRTHKRRNLGRLRTLLLEMVEAFPDASRPQRRVMRNNLAQASRQLGYDTYKIGDYGQSARYFGESFKNQPSLRTLYDFAQALLGWAHPGNRTIPEKTERFPMTTELTGSNPRVSSSRPNAEAKVSVYP